MTILDPIVLAKPERLMANGNVHTVDLLRSIAKLIRQEQSREMCGEIGQRARYDRFVRLARQIELLASTMDAEAS